MKDFRTVALAVLVLFFIVTSVMLTEEGMADLSMEGQAIYGGVKSIENSNSIFTEKGKEIGLGLSKIQIPFIKNEGQISNNKVRFYANTFAGTVFVEDDGVITYSLMSGEKGSTAKGFKGLRDFKSEPVKQGYVIKESILGIKATPKVEGKKEAVTKVNYFKGNERERWRTGIRTYEEISFGEVYEGIELRLRAYGKNIEKLFYISPDSDPESIRVKVEGSKGIKFNGEGKLEIETEFGTINFTKPVAYQEIESKRVGVEVAYVTINSESEQIYGFKVGEYDRDYPLVIDPLLASTFIGGAESDYAYSIEIDSSGNVYVAGYTYSTDYPTTAGAYDTTFNGYSDVFISKLNGNLTSLSASTFIGGTNTDSTSAIAIDSSGNVYVAGNTYSTDYPTTAGAYDTTFNGYSDVFVSKLDSNLSTLSASTFIGGTNTDSTPAIAIDSSGNVYVIGNTLSADYPATAGAYDTTCGTDGNCNFFYADVFISKLDSNLTSLSASTFIGGSRWEGVWDLAINSGNVYVAGYTYSTDYPTTAGAYDTTCGTDGACNGLWTSDIFISKLNNDLTTLSASTFMGGSSNEYAFDLTLDSVNVFVTGETYSTDYPTTAGAYDTTSNGYADVFVSKLNNDLTTLSASTFIGGGNWDTARAISTDLTGNVYIAGITDSVDYPVTGGAYDTTYNGYPDVFVSRIDSNLTSLSASTFIGGGDWEEVQDLAINSGNVYVAGYTSSTDYPATAGAYDTTCGTDGTCNYWYRDVFVSKLDSNLLAPLYVVWQDNTPGNNEIYLRRSIDGGVTWTTQRLTNNAGASMNPSVAVNGSNVYVVLQDDSYGNNKIFLRRSTDGGVTWTTQRLTNNAGASANPSIGVSGSNVYVVYQDDTPGNNEIFLKKSADGGASWTQQRLTNSAGASMNPSIAVSGSNIYVVLQDDTLGNNEIFLKMSTDGGASWTQQRLTNSVGASVNPSIELSGNNVYVVLQDDTPGNNEVFLKMSTDGGASWTQQRLTNSAGASVNPAIGVSGSNVYVVYQDDTPGNNEIYLRKSIDSGATWSTQRLTNSAGASMNPYIAVSGSNIYVALQDDSYGNNEIFLISSTDSGSTWTTVRTTNNTGSSAMPVISKPNPSAATPIEE